jgi:hypothetical protein
MKVKAFAVLTVVAFCISGAMAQPHRLGVHAKRTTHNAQVQPNTSAPAANLYGVAAFFGAEPLNQTVNSAGAETSSGTNYDPWNFEYPGGTVTSPDLWPCFGGGSFAGTANTQPDCSYIGSSSSDATVSLPAEVVIGSPSYTWYLSANTATTQPYGCDGSSASDINHFCAQAINYYEDDSGDTTDDLTWSITVTQGSNTIYDSGTQDYGPNPYGGLLASEGVAPVIIFYEDLNFGLLGAANGDVNANGPCFASYYYPATAPPSAAGQPPTNYYNGEINTFGALFGVAGTKTCSAPTAGEAATVTITTSLATPTWTAEDTASKCPESTMGGPNNGSKPYCYTVKLTTVKSVKQSFTIWLE